jgi:hypothetical protein
LIPKEVRIGSSDVKVIKFGVVKNTSMQTPIDVIDLVVVNKN